MSTAADTVRGYLAAFATGEPESIAAFVSDGFVNEHLSELGSGCVGRAEYLGRLPEFLKMFADCSYLVEDWVESSATIVVRYRFAATFEGTNIDIPGVMWFETSDGLIDRRTDLWDSLTFLRQTNQPPFS